MGMFDTVYCNYPLPPECPDWAREKGRDFQTKSLDSMMDTYTITPQGTLELTRHETEWVDDENSFLKGYLRSVKQWQEIELYHGDIEFHDIGPNDEWISLVARFSYGKLDSITLVRLDNKQ